MHSSWQDINLDCHTHFLHICTRVLALYLQQNFVSAQYLENKLTEFHQILYAFILTRSSLGLLPVIFHSFVPELWPLIYAKNSFLLNISYIKAPQQGYSHILWQFKFPLTGTWPILLLTTAVLSLCVNIKQSCQDQFLNEFKETDLNMFGSVYVMWLCLAFLSRRGKHTSKIRYMLSQDCFLITSLLNKAVLREIGRREREHTTSSIK